LPSEHRRYTQEQVERLKLVAQALSLGHRAGDVVPLSKEQLVGLLSLVPAEEASSEEREDWLEEVFALLSGFAREGLRRLLQREAMSMGAMAFVEERVLPLLRAVGEAWHRGELHIRHEHFTTELIEDTLRQMRSSLLCTLPNEQHGLGLQIVALVLALHRRPFQIVGVQTPVEEIVAVARGLSSLAVGVSVTQHTATKETGVMLQELRQQLPDHIALWIGGAGAGQLELPSGCEVVGSLLALEQVLKKSAN